ncbi:hypothetical protein [Actinoplanes sp. NPDC026619]
MRNLRACLAAARTVTTAAGMVASTGVAATIAAAVVADPLRCA